ncbi:hypothetical protein [Evansella cellulosilytica]|uniref:Uncharacterized protein n=1 Tax=Evansella cellulosilytica (strain ATCC 21833 / DSM 2522 / FERM P-1141 / JCM 9156 / N-4) TaxID=649639 RepID=E6TWQ4_EVAC2|nr:hypothetical protein [Evansella cellulosilytica]ADU28737.1 hypothetical protein Bcell_0455 [Evansella cellulosilytica DSM 2522]
MKKTLNDENIRTVKVMLLIVIVIAPLANAFGYFFIGLYILSFVSLIFLFVFDMYFKRKDQRRKR